MIPQQLPYGTKVKVIEVFSDEYLGLAHSPPFCCLRAMIGEIGMATGSIHRHPDGELLYQVVRFDIDSRKEEAIFKPEFLEVIE